MQLHFLEVNSILSPKVANNISNFKQQKINNK